MGETTGPTTADFGDAHILIEIETAPDNLGRCGFFAYWVDAGQVRGQAYCMDPDAFISRRSGRVVRRWQAEDGSQAGRP
jgi:hypothetical protein